MRKAVDFIEMVDALPRKSEGLGLATAGEVPTDEGLPPAGTETKVEVAAGGGTPGTRPTEVMVAPAPVTVVKIT